LQARCASANIGRQGQTIVALLCQNVMQFRSLVATHEGNGRGGIRTHGSQTDKAEFESDALMSYDRAKEILLTILQRLAFVDCEFGRMKLRALNVEGRRHPIRRFYFVARTCVA
jgi:hypothetical protein